MERRRTALWTYTAALLAEVGCGFLGTYAWRAEAWPMLAIVVVAGVYAAALLTSDAHYLYDLVAAPWYYSEDEELHVTLRVLRDHGLDVEADRMAAAWDGDDIAPVERVMWGDAE